MVPTVPMTPTLRFRVAATQARTPGSMTPTRGTSCSKRSRSRAAAEAVLHATTTIFTLWRSTSMDVIWREKERTSSRSRGPYG